MKRIWILSLDSLASPRFGVLKRTRMGFRRQQSTGLASAWWKAKDARGGKRMDNIDMKLLRLLMRGVPMHTAEMARLLSVT